MDAEGALPTEEEVPTPAPQVVVDAEAMLALMEEAMPFQREMVQANLALQREMKTFKISCKREIASHRLEVKKAIKAMALDQQRQLREMQLTLQRERQSQRHVLLTRVVAMLLLALVAIVWIHQGGGGEVAPLREYRVP